MGERELTEQEKKRFDGMTDKAIAKRAQTLKIKVDEEMERGDVIVAILDAEDVLREKKDTKKAAVRSDGKITLQYLNKGSLKKFGKIWRGHNRSAVSPDEARDLVQNYPTRFRRIN
jgi:sulfate adenylyltransferase subunit 1 (EFTu-like GTPase family)